MLHKCGQVYFTKISAGRGEESVQFSSCPMAGFLHKQYIKIHQFCAYSSQCILTSNSLNSFFFGVSRMRRRRHKRGVANVSKNVSFESNFLRPLVWGSTSRIGPQNLAFGLSDSLSDLAIKILAYQKRKNLEIRNLSEILVYFRDSGKLLHSLEFFLYFIP